jgi:hypothetical protein
MNTIELIMARVRIRHHSTEAGDGEPNQLFIWLAIIGITIVVVGGITLLVVIAKKKTLKRIESYFGTEGLIFIGTLDKQTRKAFIQIVSAIQLTEGMIKDGNYNVDSVLMGYVSPYSSVVKYNEMLEWYRFVAYELDALIAHAKNDQTTKDISIKKARELRGSNELISDIARLF